MSKISLAIKGFFKKIVPMPHASSRREFDRIAENQKSLYSDIADKLSLLSDELSSVSSMCKENALKTEECYALIKSGNKVAENKLQALAEKTEENSLKVFSLDEKVQKLTSEISSLASKTEENKKAITSAIVDEAKTVLSEVKSSAEKSEENKKAITSAIVDEAKKVLSEVKSSAEKSEENKKAITSAIADEAKKVLSEVKLSAEKSEENKTAITSAVENSTAITQGIIESSGSKNEIEQLLSEHKKTSEDVTKIKTDLGLFKRQSYIRQLYHNVTERKALVDSFNEIMQDKVLSEQKFKKLIKGLDEKSRDTVVRTLYRMQLVSNGNMALQDAYTQQDQEEFTRMRDEFTTKIVKLADDLYYYDGYYLPVNQFDSSVFYTRYGIDNLTTLDTIRNKHIIDAGGYVGDTAMLLSPYTDKNVHVFEASPSNMDIIKKTIELNNLSNILPIDLALGKENGTAVFSLGERNSCNSLVERPGYNYPDHIEVSVVTLDDYVKENNLEVGLIKVDIEGGEQLLLQGATETIRTQHPILLISIYHSASDFFDIKPMLEELCPEYTFRIVKPTNTAIAIETVLLAEVENK